MSRLAAKDFVDRGIDNIFLLTGGMNEFAYEYPAFVEGAPPSPPRGLVKPSRAARLTRIVEDQQLVESSQPPNSPPNRLTQSKLERHNNSYGGPAMTSGRRSFSGAGARSEAGTQRSNMSGMLYCCEVCL